MTPTFQDQAEALFVCRLTENPEFAARGVWDAGLPGELTGFDEEHEARAYVTRMAAPIAAALEAVERAACAKYHARALAFMHGFVDTAARMGHVDDVALWIAWLALTAPHGGHGMSAMNAARIALGGQDSCSRPHDPDDWGRCERLLANAPPSLRPAIEAVFAKWDEEVDRRDTPWATWAKRPKREAQP